MIAVSIIRGDRWTQTVELRVDGNPTFDWTGLTATCVLRKQRDPALPALHTFTPSLSFAAGVATITLDLPGSVSSALPLISSQCSADLHVSRVSPAYGPLTVAQFEITFLPTT